MDLDTSTKRERVPGYVERITWWDGKRWWTTYVAVPTTEEEPRVRECRCGRDGVADVGQCAVQGGWGALRPGTYCRREAS